MNTKRNIGSAAAGVFAAALVAAGGAAGGVGGNHGLLVIQHQLRGCHSWSLNGGIVHPSQTLMLKPGGTITVRNLDVMPHKLVEMSGPAVTFVRVSAGSGLGLKGVFPPASLNRMGATAKVTFTKPGVYRFTTKAGEDYMSGVKTVGEDNVLKLIVTVK